MNPSQTEETGLLDEFSRARSRALIPLAVVVGILMVVGLCGNSLAVGFYGRRKSETNRLILVVALIDTVVCIAMPKTIVIVVTNYKGYNRVLCKFNIFFDYYTVVFSGCVLVMVAVFRFRAVCRPFANQYTMRHVNVGLLASGIFSGLVCSPVFYTHDMVEIGISINETSVINGYVCQSSKDLAVKPVALVFNVITAGLFLVAVTVFMVVYSLIGKSVLKYYKSKSKLLTKHSIGTSIKNMCDISVGTLDKVATSKVSNTAFRMNEHAMDGDAMRAHFAAEMDIPSTAVSSISLVQKDIEFKEPGLEMNSELKPVGTTNARSAANTETSAVVFRQVLELFVITVVFVVSYLPYLTISVSRIVTPGDVDVVALWRQLCLRSYLINSAANPLIYGLFSSQFRDFVRQLIGKE